MLQQGTLTGSFTMLFWIFIGRSCHTAWSLAALQKKAAAMVRRSDAASRLHTALVACVRSIECVTYVTWYSGAAPSRG